MQYLGGKTKVAKHIAAKIHELVPDAAAFDDPFCGGLAVAVALSAYAPVHSADACAPLIALYEAVHNGWVPPVLVTEGTWRDARDLPDTDPMKAFCGFGCSFGGKWFGGYARNARGDNYALASSRALCRDVPRVSSFTCVDWLARAPGDTDRVIYCDPPYIGTTGYSGVSSFDHELFVDRVLEWAEYTHVFVSEYEFPVGSCVWQRDKPKTVAGGSGGGRVGVEKLFHIPKR